MTKILNEEKKKKLQELIEKHKDTFVFHRPNILVDLVDEIQKLLEFAFLIEQYPFPKIILGDDIKENDTTKSLDSDNGQIFIKLNKRSYHTQSESDNQRMFQSEKVILASSPKFSNSIRLQERDGIKEEIPIREEMFFSDNEFIFTLKTKTLKQQFEILNILERTLNIYVKRISENFVSVSGISEIKSVPRKDKDELETLEIHYQFRLKEISIYNRYYLLEAFRIAYGKFEDDEEVYRDTTTNILNKKEETLKGIKQKINIDEIKKNNQFFENYESF